MSALPRARRIAGILGALLCWTARAFASPAEEYLLDMTIVVHPDAERATPRDTEAHTQILLDEATRILEGIDGESPAEMSCPIRFRATNIRRHDPVPQPPYVCGTGSGTRPPCSRNRCWENTPAARIRPTEGFGMFVGAGFYFPPTPRPTRTRWDTWPACRAITRAWAEPCSAGGGLRTRTVPPLSARSTSTTRSAAARSAASPPACPAPPFHRPRSLPAQSAVHGLRRQRGMV